MSNDNKNTDFLPIRFLGGSKTISFGRIEYKIDPRSLHNAVTICENHSHLKKVFTYDIFADDIIITACPPWESSQGFSVHSARDEDIFELRSWLEVCGIKIGKNDCADLILALAKKNQVNPPKEYFEKLIWDKKPRLDTWLNHYLGAEKDSMEYLKIVGPKWLMGGVARILNPGCKFDNVLILEGEQYKGKSKAFEDLATFGDKCFFIDETLELGNKDSLLKLQGKIIFEMAELASFKRSKDEDIKAFITRRRDIYRPPYGRKTQDRPRMFIIGGSTNQSEYFTDPTGNRRYWPVHCSNIDNGAIVDAREQLWAEAAYRYKAGEQLWLTPEENRVCEFAQSNRMRGTSREERVLNAVDNLLYGRLDKVFSIDEVLDKWEVHIEKRDWRIVNEIKDCLQTNGYEEFRSYASGARPRRWRKKVK